MRRFCRRGVAFVVIILLLLAVLVGLTWESEWLPDGFANLVSSQALTSAEPVEGGADGADLVATTSTARQTTSTTSSKPRDDGLSLFCFAWTPRRKFDEQLLSEVRIQFAKCDGHVFYTDMGSPGAEEDDFVRVKLPAQKVSRDKGGWLYHRNMVGLMPALTNLLGSKLIERYDWFINSELDHFLSPARARANIAAYVSHIDTPEDRPVMLMWGNAFVFNRKLLQELQKYWHTLGVTASDNGTKDEAIAVGCPMFMKGKAEWPGSCSQDIIYPALAWDILPKISKQKVMTLGDPGCGHPSKFQNKELPLGCWEMQQNPLGGESLQGELKAIRVLADMESLNAEAAESYCVAHGDPLAKNCKKFHDGRHVAVIHHVNNLAVHSLARQLLDHETVGAVASSTAAGAVAGAAPLQTAVSTSKAPAPFLATASPTAGSSVPVSQMGHSVSDIPVSRPNRLSTNMTLFCFAWSPRRKNDEGVLNEVRKQYRKCDGHLFFTDTASPNKTDEEDFVRIIVPQQRLARGHGQWLYHRNMVGLMPSWEYLLQSGVADQYDWLLNSELDHFLSPSRAKENIEAYLQKMEEGNNEDKLAVDGPIMLMWGNAFVFNRKFVQALKEHWPVVGQVASTDNQTSKEGRAVGCPLFMKGRSEWPDSCSQDIIYPTLAMNVLPPLKVKVAFPGASGCGQHSKNRKNREYPLGCWEMQQNPLQGESEAGELAAIKELAQMATFKAKSEAKAYCDRHDLEVMQKNCMKFWDGRRVPLIHHLHTVSEHVLARTLLDNDPDP
ncbi:unnamed protein product [Durusdinium trenchii]|uniref:Protein xylosyltransferase n=2 Tax=Durusdinium trenchii TaxID=1381693 RepID=A0ABP0RRS3_9DINO